MADYYTSQNIAAGVVMIVILLLLFLRFGGKSNKRKTASPINTTNVPGPVREKIKKVVEKEKPDYKQLKKDVQKDWRKARQLKDDLLALIKNVSDLFGNAGRVRELIEDLLTGFFDYSQASMLTAYDSLLTELRDLFDNNVNPRMFNDFRQKFDELLDTLRSLDHNLHALLKVYELYLNSSDLARIQAEFNQLRVFLSDELRLFEDLNDFIRPEPEMNRGNIFYPDWLTGFGEHTTIPGVNNFTQDGNRAGINYQHGIGFCQDNANSSLRVLINEINGLLTNLNTIQASTISEDDYRTQIIDVWANIRRRIMHFYVFIQYAGIRVNTAINIEDNSNNPLSSVFRFINRLDKHNAFRLTPSTSNFCDRPIIMTTPPNNVIIQNQSNSILINTHQQDLLHSISDVSSVGANDIIGKFAQSLASSNVKTAIQNMIGGDLFNNWEDIIDNYIRPLNDNNRLCQCGTSPHPFGENLVNIFRALREFRGLEWLFNNNIQGWLERYCTQESRGRGRNAYRLFLRNIFLNVVNDETTHPIINIPAFEIEPGVNFPDFELFINDIESFDCDDINEFIFQAETDNDNLIEKYTARFTLLGIFLVALVCYRAIQEIVTTTN